MNLEERVAATIAEYDRQGWHRTGTDVDLKSASWLMSKARACSSSVEENAFQFVRFEPMEAHLTVGEDRFEGLPLFDGGTTGDGAVTGRLGELGSEAEIGVTTLGAGDRSRIERLLEERHTGRHRAIVVVTLGRSAGLVAQNATHYTSPFGPPVLLVESSAAQRLSELAEEGANATLVIAARRVPSQSANVVARLTGSGASGVPPLMVTTPRTGWWNCASERGGGIACWLEAMRTLASNDIRRDVWFVSFAGHELGHMGLNQFLKSFGPGARGAFAWVHFGANVGGATDPTVRVAASQKHDLHRALDCLLKAGVQEVTTAPEGRLLGLEPQSLHEQGGRCVSLLGGNSHFHMISDRWPDAVNVASVAKQAQAFSDLLLELCSE